MKISKTNKHACVLYKLLFLFCFFVLFLQLSSYFQNIPHAFFLYIFVCISSLFFKDIANAMLYFFAFIFNADMILSLSGYSYMHFSVIYVCIVCIQSLFLRILPMHVFVLDVFVFSSDFRRFNLAHLVHYFVCFLFLHYYFQRFINLF